MQRVKTESGVDLAISFTEEDGKVTLRIVPVQSTDAVMHWGGIGAREQPWRLPDSKGWPTGSEPHGSQAVRTPLAGRGPLDPVVIRLDASEELVAIEFVLHHFREDRWDDHAGHNYRVELPRSVAERRLSQQARAVVGEPVTNELVEAIEQNARVAVVSAKRGTGMVVAVVTDYPAELLLHWGVARDWHQWTAPPAPMQPEGSETLGNAAARTRFTKRGGVQVVALEVAGTEELHGVRFVLYDPKADRWIRRGGADFFVRMPGVAGPSLSRELTGIADAIVEHEANRESMSQVHRFNLANDLIEDFAIGDVDAMAMIFVWLRYWALGQLDEQRDSQPESREFIHATDRFTRLLAFRYDRDVRARRLIRWMLTTVGRGGDGQRVRDDILQIMHHHGIKETRGQFWEQWHQKLHNDTSPEDVVICDAYLSFLRSGGELDSFYETLAKGGVSRERLRGFERPIQAEPEFPSTKLEELVRDLMQLREHLASVHDGGELESALRRADRALDPDIRADAWWIHEHRRDADTCALVRVMTRVREWICARRQGDRDDTRDLLSLDVALEAFLRVVLERSEGLRKDERLMVSTIPLALRNLSLSVGGEADLQACVRQWERLELASTDEVWALRAERGSGPRVARVGSEHRRHPRPHPAQGGASRASPRGGALDRCPPSANRSCVDGSRSSSRCSCDASSAHWRSG